MVKDVLENYDSLKDDGATKVATQEKAKTNKYLKFDTVSVDKEINILKEAARQAEETAKLENIEAESNSTHEEIKETIEIVDEAVVKEQQPKKAKLDKDDKASKQNNAKKDKAKTVKNNKKEKTVEKVTKQNQPELEYISYSAALDFESQSII